MDDYFSRKIAQGEARGERKGKREGMREGRSEASRDIYHKLLEMGFTPELASQATGVTLQQNN